MDCDAGVAIAKEAGLMISANDLMKDQSTEPANNELEEADGEGDFAVCSQFTGLKSGNSAVHTIGAIAVAL